MTARALRVAGVELPAAFVARQSPEVQAQLEAAAHPRRRRSTDAPKPPPDPYAATRRWADAPVVVDLPGLELVSEANTRGHWAKKARRTKAQRLRLRALLLPLACPAGERWVVTITRRGPKLIDDDNATRSGKGLRDEAGLWLGTGDAPEAPVTWQVVQERGAPGEYAARVEVRAVTATATTEGEGR